MLERTQKPAKDCSLQGPSVSPAATHLHEDGRGIRRMRSRRLFNYCVFDNVPVVVIIIIVTFAARKPESAEKSKTRGDNEKKVEEPCMR